MMLTIDVIGGFFEGLFTDPTTYDHQRCKKSERESRSQFSEQQIDRMIESSFPASDPPSTY